MTPTTIPGYLTKKEVEERYGRSHRSLTRDFSSAVRRGDAKILAHLKLQTEDGTIRPGGDVTLKQIQDWSNQGLSPTWYVEGEWAAQRYGVRSTPLPDGSSAAPEDAPSRAENSPGHRSDLADLIRRLDEQIQDLRQELKIKNEQIQQANDRTRESNVLMKELQTLLGNMQERALLARVNPQLPDATVHFSDAIVPADPSPTVHRQSSKSTSVKSRPRSEQGTGRQKLKGSPAPVMASATETKSEPRWYEMPTFKKFLHREK